MVRRGAGYDKHVPYAKQLTGVSVGFSVGSCVEGSKVGSCVMGDPVG